MPDIYGYSSDPGLETLLGNGAVLNYVQGGLPSVQLLPGEDVFGAVGAVVNDRGAPNVPVELKGGIADIHSVYGGFKASLGDGAATGYEGNLAFLLDALRLPRIIIQPVDLAIKTASIGDSGVDLSVSFTRSDAANGAKVIKAGHRISSAAAAYVLATLEDVAWTEAETGSKTVRCRQVSGTAEALDDVNLFVDATPDANITINTAITTIPDAVDAAELALRYEAAIDALNSNEVGSAINIVVTDRNEPGIADYLSASCADSLSDGIFRSCVVAPPIGTTVAAAEATTADGVGRATLTGGRAVYVHPGLTRKFTRDTALAGASVVYPGQAFAAALICNARAEENPMVASEIGSAAGVISAEILLTKAEKVSHFRKFIAAPAFEFLNGRRVMSYRDGIMADGTKIADRRIQDFIASGLIVTLSPHHKRIATEANRQAALDAAINYLERQRKPAAGAAPRIANYSLGSDWSAVDEHFQLTFVIQKLGNLDVMTLRLNVTADNIEITA